MKPSITATFQNKRCGYDTYHTVDKKTITYIDYPAPHVL